MSSYNRCVMGRLGTLSLGWLFDGKRGPSDRLLSRWVFLRALGAVYFSAFFSLAFQIRGLIGPEGILPAGSYLQAVAQALGHVQQIWYAPTVLRWSSSTMMLNALCWLGMLAALLLVLNLWPRGMLLLCFILFLSFVSAAQDFSGYQSDGMLLEAGFLSLFLAPRGFWPGLGRGSLPARASLFLLQWEWFRIYFQSGLVKLMSGDPQWRNFTAMDEYYQNGPLPTWIGWYVQHLPHWFHASSVYATLALELGLVWMMFLPRPWKIVCFFIVTPWQIGVILTANYAFLNYLVLAMGFLLLDDRFVLGVLPQGSNIRNALSRALADVPQNAAPAPGEGGLSAWALIKVGAAAFMLTWIGYATIAQSIWTFTRVPFATLPVRALDPFRVANTYGLFAVMTRGRYEIEFQGSADGQNWVAYPFRYKPQALDQPPRIYAPYQPRFEWNLWFASLGSWRSYPFVPSTEVRLLLNDRDVLALFASNPFGREPPRQVRAMLWQYWFTTMAEKRATGLWWKRQLIGLYAPTLERTATGEIKVIDMATVSSRAE